MASIGPELPTKFPCWCRAIYSWEGETDKDLGFVEGDLIECLNAGDGSWWMGRLRRDRRMMGLFPSNFVIVLDDSFQPVSRSSSQLPEPQPKTQSQKQKPWRKPFSGYKGAGTTDSTPTRPRTPMKDNQGTYDSSNPPSTVLWQMGSHAGGPSRTPSPMQQDSSPPPPPPHRVGVEQLSARAPTPQRLEMNDRYQSFSRTPSPRPPSLNGHTPPMLRDAMDDVMSSLEVMSMARTVSESEKPFNPWSPEAFDELHRPKAQKHNIRPLTSLGLDAGGSDFPERQGYSNSHNAPDMYDDGRPQLGSYVQRMESRLRQMQEQKAAQSNAHSQSPEAPTPPAKNSPWNSRPNSAMAGRKMSMRNRKSTHKLGQEALGRTFTAKSSATNSSSGVLSNATGFSNQSSKTSQSIMSGRSAGGFSATSAGSLARRNKFDTYINRPATSAGTRGQELRPQTPSTRASFQSSQYSRQGAQSALGMDHKPEGSGGLGGFATPKPKKAGFFKKLIEGAKTSAASARSTIAVTQGLSVPSSPTKLSLSAGIVGVGNGTAAVNPGRDAASEMGLGGGGFDYIKIRRDVNRSNTPGPQERQERAERCQLLDHPVICPIDELFETAEGNEGAEAMPVLQPFQLNNPSYSLVDKAARFITSLPAVTTAASLAQGYVCRPHRSDVHRLRAIFTWVSERISWDEDFEGPIDSRRVIQTKRGCSHELAQLVFEMCHAISIHAEVVRGYLKAPGEDLDLDALNRPNHFWNAIFVDSEWRLMDCSLASPTNPKRGLYSSVSNTIAEPFYFLAKPLEFCYTHIPLNPFHQHIVPPISPDILLSLPSTLPPYFRQSLLLDNYDTSLIRLDGLETCALHLNVPADVEVVAEVETKSYLRDADGDLYENSDTVTRKRALAQASWYIPDNNPNVLQKRYVVKALLPGDEGIGVLKIYAGKKGLMHSSKDIPHALALAVPLYHQGENPEYEFLLRHPTPHAVRQDLYVLQPQCRRLGTGETYVFAVRQHAASVAGACNGGTPVAEHGGFDVRPASPNPGGMGIFRPGSAMSMSSSAAGSGSGSGPANVNGSEHGEGSSNSGLGVRVKDKPAKLAVQSPGGKILRLQRKAEPTVPVSRGGGVGMGEVQGSVWEATVKVQERGTWRGLVLADRSARWCVWGEWECV